MVMPYFFRHVVLRSKMCLDFTATMYGFHLFNTLIYSGFTAPPVSFWILNGACFLFVTLVSEWTCLRLEMEEIPVGFLGSPRDEFARKKNDDLRPRASSNYSYRPVRTSESDSEMDSSGSSTILNRSAPAYPSGATSQLAAAAPAPTPAAPASAVSSRPGSLPVDHPAPAALPAARSLSAAPAPASASTSTPTPAPAPARAQHPSFRPLQPLKPLQPLPPAAGAPVAQPLGQLQVPSFSAQPHPKPHGRSTALPLYDPSRPR
jgi:hypothetical protein